MERKTTSLYILSVLFFLLIWMMIGCSGLQSGGDFENATEEYVIVSEIFALEEDVESIMVYEGDIYYCTAEGEVKRRKPEADAASETIAVLNFDQDTYVWEGGNPQPDLEGNLYVLYMVRKKNSLDSVIYLAKYNAAGLELFQKDVSRLFPYGMGEETAVDKESHLFAVGKDGRVFGFDTDGTHRKTIVAPNNESIWGLACDEESKVYCASWGSKSSTIRTMDPIMALLDTARVIGDNDEQILSIIQEESAAFFDGQKSAEETVEVIQNRVFIYLQEQE